jgi:hypothetical protein
MSADGEEAEPLGVGPAPLGDPVIELDAPAQDGEIVR